VPISPVEKTVSPGQTPNERLSELSLIIPAYNEEASIEDIVRRASTILEQCASQWEVIVVSDCSTDATTDGAVAAGAVVITHPLNRGYGNSLKTGINNAKYGTIAIIDADGSYSPEDLLHLIPFVSQFDMIVGQRSGTHFHGGPIKFMGRRLQLFLVEFTTGTKVPDVNSGLRIFPRELSLTFFDNLCGGFSFTTSITLAMLMNDYTIKFVPVSYEARTGKSNVCYYRDTLRSLQIITHAILKFNPIKMFLLLSMVPLVCMGVSGICALPAAYLHHFDIALFFGVIAILFMLTALIILALGFVATTITNVFHRPSFSDKRHK
jgi:glycosyltransferase involved in cell wall biosynthesis